LDSVDQGAFGIPLSAVSNAAGVLSFADPAIGGAFSGKWDPTAGGFVGVWKQGPVNLPLTLRAGRPVIRECGPPGATEPEPTKLPESRNFLFWTPAQQRIGYRNIERIFPTHLVRRGDHVAPLPMAAHSLAFSFDCNGARLTVDDFVRDDHVAGLLVIKDGKIVLERYGLGQAPTDRWPSFSVAKSVTSTLVGAAIKDGYIKSLDEPVVTYLPGLKGSAYDGVTVRQLLTMTSGVKWNEDYADPKSDVNALLGVPPPASGENPLIAYMAKLPRDAAPGSRFHYSTGEADLIGLVVANATRKTLAAYLSEKIWGAYGMEKDAIWSLQPGTSFEVGGCCISMTLRDYGRFGQFMLGGGVARGHAVLPDGWIADATTNHNPAAQPTYGYQWWIRPDGYQAIGIFGQSVYVNPAKHLVVVLLSAWPKASDPESAGVNSLMFEALLKTIG
jgi:CubicO group peptidase (beta-lactamase class C family)